MNDQKKEHLIIYGGLVFIMLIFVVTVFRATSSTNNRENKSDLPSQNISKSTNYKTISPTDLQKSLLLSKEKDGIILLDIRDYQSYISEHIMDSVNFTLSEFPLDQKIDSHKKIVVIAQNKEDADIQKAVDALSDENFSNVVVLAGGIDGWKQFLGPTVTYGDPKSFSDQSKVTYIDPQNLKDALDQKQLVYIVDIRSQDDFNKGHIEGSVNIPFDTLEKDRSKISQRKVVIVGATELEEFQAGVQMNDMLLISPFVMRTGIPGWQKQGFPLVQH